MMRELGVTLRARITRPDAVTVAVLVVTLAALLMRLYDLGARAMHHDESLHAIYSWYYAEGRGYEHDPLMHGPLQFHLIAGLFRVLGDSEVVSRLPAAFAGTALVAAPLLLRRWLGGPATVIAALLLTVSPSLLYFSRFARNDLLVALWTLLIVTAVWRYREHGGWGWLLLLATALALSFATKETAYITAAVMLLYLNVVLWLELLTRRRERGRRRFLEAALLLPVAWVIAVFWRPLASRLGLGKRPREADLLIVLGTLTLPFLSALVRVPAQALAGPLDANAEFSLALATVIAAFAAAAAVGLLWSVRRWTPLMAVVVVITLPLYTAGFTNLDGSGGAFWNSLDYWLDQQEVQRGTQPWFYYFMMVPLYEFMALIPAVAGGLWLLLRRDRLAALLLWWFAGTFIILSYAGEKMPWLTVHMALPLALLAARALGLAASSVVPRLRGAAAVPVRAGALAAALLLALLFAASVRASVEVTYAHPDTPVEPLIYTQTSPDVPALLRQILALSEQAEQPLTITVDTTASFSWPWAWYLRDYPAVSYGAADYVGERTPEDGIVIAARSTLSANPELERRFAFSSPYRHRWWFPEQGYRATTGRSLLAGMRDGSLFGQWRDFYWSRGDESAIGSIDGAVLFPQQPPAVP